MKKNLSLIGIIAAVVIVALSLVLGTHFGSDFGKYNIVRVSSTREFSLEKAQDAVAGLGIRDLKVTIAKENYNSQVVVTGKDITEDDARAIVENLRKQNDDAYLRSHETSVNAETAKVLIKIVIVLAIIIILTSVFAVYRLGLNAGLYIIISEVASIVLSAAINSLAGIALSLNTLVGGSLVAVSITLIYFYSVAARMDLKGTNRGNSDIDGIYGEAVKSSLTKLIPVLFLIIALNVASIIGNGIAGNMMSIVFSILAGIYGAYLIGLPMYAKASR